MIFVYNDELKKQLAPFLTELNFEEQQDGIFLRDGFAFKVDYDEEHSLVRLLGGKTEEGKELEFAVLSQYLFDGSHSVRDVKAVGIDFEETLRTQLGAKKVEDRRTVAMPTRAAAGETPTVEAFTKGFLDICPQYRENYQDMLAGGGSFMYVEFYSQYGIEKMHELTDSKNEKQLGKFLSFLNKYYSEGDRTVAAIVSTIFFAGAFYDRRDQFEKVILPRLDNMPYLKAAAINSLDYIAKSKKLREALAL